MIVLWNQYPDFENVFSWLNWATLKNIHRNMTEETYGPYTGGHFDGSTGRTLCMHMMLCSQGTRAVPFMEGLRLGGIKDKGSLYLSLESDRKWTGKICFDPPRTEYKTATINWARINQMPQWFVVRPEQKYAVNFLGLKSEVVDGQKLIDGIKLTATPGQTQRILVTPL